MVTHFCSVLGKRAKICVGLSALLGACVLILAPPTVNAQTSETIVRPDPVQVDWPAVARSVVAVLPDFGTPLVTSRFSVRQRAAVARRLKSYTVKDGMLPLASLSELTASSYPAMADAVVPVLAPVDPTRLLPGALPAAQTPTQARRALLARSIASLQAISLSSGYDVVATVSGELLRELAIDTPYKVQVHIGGSALSYGREQGGELVPDMQDVIAGVRRIEGADEITYVFRKYNVPYFANIDCSRASNDGGIITCPQADAVVRAVLRDLRLAGGGPRKTEKRAASIICKQPTRPSPTFQYHAPGKLLDGTSEQNKDGAGSQMVHGNCIRFPLKDAPAFANSQVFMHRGDCRGQKVALPAQPGDRFPRYRCRQNHRELLDFEGHRENYSYPWRDNACEARGRAGPAECPVRKGHEGQDIRPSKCEPQHSAAASCPINVFAVVAVTDGKAWWKPPPKDHVVRLHADDGTGLYYTFLHMSPASITNTGIVSGTFVPVRRDGTIGKVGNFARDEQGRPSPTTTHLHFEIRRLQADVHAQGPALAPYLTLIRAYERLIREIGTELP